MWRKGNTRELLVGMQTGVAVMESNVELPQKIRNATALRPNSPLFVNTLSIHPFPSHTLMPHALFNSLDFVEVRMMHYHLIGKFGLFCFNYFSNN